MRILLVDDNDDGRLLAGMELKKSGSDVIEATNLDDALKALDTGAFDLVLTDWMLTRNSTSEELVRESLQRGIKTVIYTADRGCREIAASFDDKVEVLSKRNIDIWLNIRNLGKSVER